MRARAYRLTPPARASPSRRCQNAGVDVEPIALQGKPIGGDRLGDPRKGPEIGEREAHHLGLDPFEAPLRLVARGLHRWLADLDPRGDEVLRLRRRAINHRLHAAALPVPHHHKARNLEHSHAEFERRARSVMGGIGAIGGNERRDVADDEQFARHGAEYGLGIDARIRAGDDDRLRALPPMGQRLIARPLGRPDLGAKAVIAFDQRVHKPASQQTAEMLRCDKAPAPAAQGADGAPSVFAGESRCG